VDRQKSTRLSLSLALANATEAGRKQNFRCGTGRPLERTAARRETAAQKSSAPTLNAAGNARISA
jgi:hypothetical protein